MFKFFHSYLKKCYTEERKLQFSSSAHFSNQALFQISSGRGKNNNHAIDDVFEGFDIRLSGHRIDDLTGATISDNILIAEKPVFFMYSLFDGDLEEGKKIFCQKSDEFPNPYDAWVEISDVENLADAITNSKFYLPEIPPPHNQYINPQRFFMPLISGPVTYNTNAKREWNDPIDAPNPFFKWESYKNQKEFRFVLRPTPEAYKLKNYTRVLAIVPDLEKIVGNVHQL